MASTILNPTDAAGRRRAISISSSPPRYDAVMMVESEAKELSEEVMLGAVVFAHDASRTVIDAIIKLAEKAAKEPVGAAKQGDDKAAKSRPSSRRSIGDDIAEGLPAHRQVSSAQTALGEARAKAKAAMASKSPQEQMVASKLVKKLEADIVRGAILKEGRRIDGRDTRTVRPIEATRALPAARARLGAVHPRRDPNHRHLHLGHQGIRADDRWPDRAALRAFHAALQLPALFGR